MAISPPVFSYSLTTGLTGVVVLPSNPVINLPQPFDIYEGDYFELQLGGYSDTNDALYDVQYSIVGGPDKDFFSCVRNVLRLEAKVSASPVDADRDNIYVVSVDAVSTITGIATNKLWAVRVRPLVLTAGTRYIGPIALGLKNGSTWANQAAMSSLDGMIQLAGPDGQVLIAADQGGYTAGGGATISHGGGPGHPVTIKGANADLSPGTPVITGARFLFVAPIDPETPTSVKGKAAGSTLWKLAFGANNLKFQNLSLTRVGAFVQFTGSVHGYLLDSITVFNCQRFVEHDIDITVGNVEISNPNIDGYSKQAVRIRGVSHDWNTHDFFFDSHRQDGDNFADANETSQTAFNINWTDGILKNSYQSVAPSSFANADGSSTERRNGDHVYTRVTSQGHTDAGFDNKLANAATVTFVGCISQDSRANYKRWNILQIMTDCQSIDPRNRQGNGGPCHFEQAANGGVESNIALDAVTTLIRPVIRGSTGNHANIFFNNRGLDAHIACNPWRISATDWDIVVDPDTTTLATVNPFSDTFITWDPPLPSALTASPTFAVGVEAGVTDEASAIGTTLATLSGSGTDMTGTMLFRVASDPDGKFVLDADGVTLKLAATLNASVKTSHSCTITAYDPSGLVKTTLTVTIYVNATVLDADMTTFETALTGAGLATPSTTGRRWRSAYDNLFRGLKAINAGGYWAQVDGVQTTVSYVIGVAKRNLRQNLYHATWNGSATWSAKNPWTGNGSDAWIDFNFNPFTATTPHFVQNSAHLFLHKTGSNVDENILDFGEDVTSRKSVIKARSSGNFATGLNSGGSFTTANADSRAWYGVNRIVAGSFKQIVNSTVASNTDTSATIVTGAFKAGHDTSGIAGGGFTTGAYDFFSWGGGSPGEQADFLLVQAAVAQYLAQAAGAE